jgi:16S rRNA (cytosine967-C5)-methyltransferase
MTPGAQTQAAIEVLDQLYAAWTAKKKLPVDALFADYFRSRKYIGSKDRGAISDLVYFCLRNGGALEWHVESTGKTANPRRIVMLGVMFMRKLDLEGVKDLFNWGKYCPTLLTDVELGIVQRLECKELIDPAMPDAAKFNYPDWMDGRLKDAFGDKLEEAMAALNSQAPIDLRANLLKCKDRSDLILALDGDGYFGNPTPLSPLGVRLKKRLAAFNTKAFKEGMYEMQDEGSQIVAQLVEARAGQKVIDFCAGAGGKTLAIAAAMENKGRILAWDTAEGRLEQMRKRLRRSGASNVQMHVLRDEYDPFIKRHVGTADWVVVDAPCSGSGTWRRNPDLKWRFTLEDLQEVKAVQARILQSASRLLSPKGKLVYITCSVFKDENIWQVKQFLGENPAFKVVRPNKVWDKLTQTVADVGPVIQLSPHQEGTDGFFAAILQQQG